MKDFPGPNCLYLLCNVGSQTALIQILMKKIRKLTRFNSNKNLGGGEGRLKKEAIFQAGNGFLPFLAIKKCISIENEKDCSVSIGALPTPTIIFLISSEFLRTLYTSGKVSRL